MLPLFIMEILIIIVERDWILSPRLIAVTEEY